VVLGKPSYKPNGSIFFKTACAKILRTPPSTTYIKLSQIGEPRLSRFGRGLYAISLILKKRFELKLYRFINTSIHRLLFKLRSCTVKKQHQSADRRNKVSYIVCTIMSIIKGKPSRIRGTI